MASDTWLALALATVVIWGIGTLISKPATMRLGTRRMLAFIVVFEGGAYAVLYLLLRTPLSPSETTGLLAGFLAAVTGTLGYIFFYEGILVGSVGLVGTVTAAYPVPTILLSIGFLGESLGLSEVLGILLVLACVVVLSRERGSQSGGQRSAAGFAFLAFVAWGLWGYFAKVAVDRIGEGNVFGFYALSNVFILGAFIVLTRKRPLEAPHADRGHAVALGLLDVAFGVGGVIALTFAYAMGPASLVSAVTGSYPLVSTLAAHFVLRERFGWKEAVALALFIPGIVLVAV